MKASTKKALERAAEVIQTAALGSSIGEVDARYLMWVDGEGTPRSPLTWTRAGSTMDQETYQLVHQELERIASRLQRMEGPRGRRIRTFVVGLQIALEEHV